MDVVVMVGLVMLVVLVVAVAEVVSRLWRGVVDEILDGVGEIEGGSPSKVRREDLPRSASHGRMQLIKRSPMYTTDG